MDLPAKPIRFNRARVLLTFCIMTMSAAQAEVTPAPLVDAIEQKNWSRVDELLTNKADVNQTQPDGMTALHWAVFHGREKLVKQLIEADAKVDARNRYGVPPLYLACLNGNGSLVSLLLGNGADANHELAGGETMLMTAARTGVLQPVQALIKHGADVDARDKEDQTALMWAAAEGNVEVVRALIESEADYTTPLKSGFTPFFFAVREGQIDVALHLLKQGIDVNEPMRIERKAGKGPARGTTALLLAVENGHFELAAELLKAGAYPDEKRLGYTALHALTWVRKPLRGDGDPPPVGSGKLSSLEFVRLLVENGADVNARHAKRNGSKARLNMTDATPFLLAASTGDLPLLKLLYDLGADPSLSNADKTTPLLAASGVDILGSGYETPGTEEEAVATIQYLLDLGADINAVDEKKMTAMHGAAYKSWTKLIALLAERGARVEVWNQKNHFKRTPMEIAQGHRPGNFRPSAETIVALEKVLGKTEAP